ncbi:hypothetical protein TNCV_2302141 [Trichonephila clavipes]|nr:hypothetical protein TNCV_2302141 [Trichonephila clavipes]
MENFMELRRHSTFVSWGRWVTRMVRKKKRAKNPRKNIALTAKEIESSSSPNKISENHTSKMEAKNENKIKREFRC